MKGVRSCSLSVTININPSSENKSISVASLRVVLLDTWKASYTPELLSYISSFRTKWIQLERNFDFSLTDFVDDFVRRERHLKLRKEMKFDYLGKFSVRNFHRSEKEFKERIEQRFVDFEPKVLSVFDPFWTLRKFYKRQLKDKSKLNHTDENFSRESLRNQTKECVLHKSKRDLFIPKINFTRCV